MRQTEKIDLLIKHLKATASDELDQRIEALVAEQASHQPGSRNRWRTIMNHSITKFAAAAIVFAAVVLGITLIPNTEGPLALTSIIETIQNAACVSYDIRMSEDTPVIHDTVYGNIIRRQALGSTTLIDLDNKKILTLAVSEKQAILIGFDGLPELPKNYVDHLVHILSRIQSAQEKPGYEYQPLASKEMDGQRLEGHAFKSGSLDVEVWIAPETSLPSVISEKRPGLTVTMTNFKIVDDPDLSLFDMTVPDGFTLVDGQSMIDFTKDANEDTFIEGLRIQAFLYDGWFPQDISIESYLRRAPDIGSLIETKFDGKMAQMQAGISLGKGLVFLRFYKGQGPWHYCGNGVQFGESETPVFWYQPKDSDHFRVIFGDLHVEDVQPEDLDALVEARIAAAVTGYQVHGREDVIMHQADTWYIRNDPLIEVHSDMTIARGPRELPEIHMVMPAEKAELVSATIGDSPLAFEENEQGELTFFPEPEQIHADDNVIHLIWQFPFDSLKPMTEDPGFWVPLKSLAPATDYTLTAVLEPDCGRQWSMSPDDMQKARKLMPPPEPDNPRMLTLFSINRAKAINDFGKCGLMIKPEQ